MSKASVIAKVIRHELITSVTDFKGLRVGVALSGGVDSCSILAAMRAAEVRPVVISYTPDTHDSTDFQMAMAVAERFKLTFVPAYVRMGADSLERYARRVIELGYNGKVEVECLSPVIGIVRAAMTAGVQALYTGDQADGFFSLSKWASHNADRSRGVPRGERTNVQSDLTSERIDQLRRRYWNHDKSCSAGVARIIEAENSCAAVIPYRNKKILDAFMGSLWSEVNKPRLKEPIRLAFEEEMRDIPTRKMPVNLHKGDSEFAVTMGNTLMKQSHLKGHWSTPRGLYAAMARGEV